MFKLREIATFHNFFAYEKFVFLAFHMWNSYFPLPYLFMRASSSPYLLFLPTLNYSGAENSSISPDISSL